MIGAANVVEPYIINRRAPVPTDGRVRVDEPFLFRTGSAEIDPANDATAESRRHGHAAEPARSR